MENTKEIEKDDFLPVLETENENDFVENDLSLSIPQMIFDVDLLVSLAEKAKDIDKMQKTVSISPKYWEAKQSLQDCLEMAKKQPENKRDDFMQTMSSNYSIRGLFIGIRNEPFVKNEQKIMIPVAYWYNNEGIWCSFGVQLVSVLSSVRPSSGIEIVYSHSKTTKNNGGNVKIYDVIPLIEV